MKIFFNIDPLGMGGLGATLTSLVRNCSSPKQLEFHFLCSDLCKKDKLNIEILLKSEGFDNPLHYHDFDAKKEFGHLKSLHGNWTPYGRLLIPQIVNTGVAAYFDADLIILVDVLELQHLDLDHHYLAAVPGGTMEYCLESKFYIEKLNIQKNALSFNSGVLIYNINEWHHQNITRQIDDIANKYPQELLSCDQALLNAVCKGNFFQLPKKFNTWYLPNDQSNYDTFDGILHFVGSPKPWDMGARLVHKGHRSWNVYDTDFWKSHYGKLTKERLQRLWNIRRSYLRLVRNSF